jgi:hypothetical protein
VNVSVLWWQIVGLTASIGVEKATTSEEAKESLLTIMANLDVTTISEVIENQEELLRKVPRPDEGEPTLSCENFFNLSSFLFTFWN